MKIYVAGPMRGYDQFNFPAFAHAAAELRSLDHEVLSPAERDLAEGFDPTKNSLDGFDVEAALAADFKMILDADAIALLPGWEKSAGARAERFVAETTGKKVFLFNADRLGCLEFAEDWSHDPHVGIRTPEIRVTDPNTGGMKGRKEAQLGALDPTALLRVAEVAGFGTSKYARYNFLKGYDWSLSFDAAMRHALAFWSGEDADPESGKSHLAHWAWHSLALLAFVEHGLGTDDRPGK